MYSVLNGDAILNIKGHRIKVTGSNTQNELRSINCSSNKSDTDRGWSDWTNIKVNIYLLTFDKLNQMMADNFTN